MTLVRLDSLQGTPVRGHVFLCALCVSECAHGPARARARVCVCMYMCVCVCV